MTGNGLTVFIEMGNMQTIIGRYDNLQLPTTNEQPPLQQSESAIRPHGLPSPNKLSKQKRGLRELIHLPYRRCCSVSVQAKGKNAP